MHPRLHRFRGAMVARLPPKQKVEGSNPFVSLLFFLLATLWRGSQRWISFFAFMFVDIEGKKENRARETLNGNKINRLQFFWGVKELFFSRLHRKTLLPKQ